MAETRTSSSSPLLIAIAWLIVVIPAAWGLTYTVQNAKKLFVAGPAAAAPVAPAPAAH